MVTLQKRPVEPLMLAAAAWNSARGEAEESGWSNEVLRTQTSTGNGYGSREPPVLMMEAAGVGEGVLDVDGEKVGATLDTRRSAPV